MGDVWAWVDELTSIKSRWIPTLAMWGAAAGGAVALFMSGVPIFQTDVLKKIPFLDQYYKGESAARASHETAESATDQLYTCQIQHPTPISHSKPVACKLQTLWKYALLDVHFATRWGLCGIKVHCRITSLCYFNRSCHLLAQSTTLPGACSPRTSTSAFRGVR